MENCISFEKLLESKERNRKKKKKFPDYWIIRGYKKDNAFDLAKKFYYGTISVEELKMTNCTTTWNINFWIIRGYTKEEAIEKIVSIQKSNNALKLKKYSKKELSIQSSTSIEYWMNRTGGDLELSKKLRSDRQSTFSYEKCIQKYGEELGKCVWEDRQIRWQKSIFDGLAQEEIDKLNASKAMNLDRMIVKYGEAEGTYRYNKWKQFITSDRFSLKYYIRLYGVSDGTAAYNEQSKKFSYARSLQGYIDRHGDAGVEIRKFHFDNVRFAGTLDGYIKRLGEVEGTKRWENKIARRSRWYSQESIDFFHSFIPINIMKSSYYADNEYFIRNGNSIYFYDFKYKNIIIEYHGERFHPNPNVLSEDQLCNWKHPYNTKMTYKHALEKDEIKRKLAIDSGFRFFEIYSNDAEDRKIFIKSNILKAIHEENYN